jgi:hypothetical protein
MFINFDQLRTFIGLCYKSTDMVYFFMEYGLCVRNKHFFSIFIIHVFSSRNWKWNKNNENLKENFELIN